MRIKLIIILLPSGVVHDGRSALEYCQEAVTILAHLCSNSEAEEEANGYHLSHVQDRLAAAYMWQALLEHEVLIKTATTMDDCDTEEVGKFCPLRF